ncbi:MAG TPA: adenosylcobinamide-GDP ribazoletransferase [Thermodesulfobacteriota bacterium]
MPDPLPAWWRPVVALHVLTRFPYPRDLRPAPVDLGRSMAWFPAVGALLGAGLAAAHALLAPWLPPLALAPLLLAGLAFATNAFHLDGVADAADGLGGGFTRDDALRIMRDSRIGAFGAIAVALLLLVQAGALAALPPEHALGALVAGPTVGRLAAVGLAHVLPYARDGGGLGSPFAAHARRRDLVPAAGVGVGTALLAMGPTRGAAALAAAGLVAVVVGRLARRRLGGVTGDLLGCATEWATAAVWLVAAARG